MRIEWVSRYTTTPGNEIFEKADGSKLLVIRKYKDVPYWELFVTHPHVDLLKKVVNKKFKLKIKALEYAKQYMRSH